MKYRRAEWIFEPKWDGFHALVFRDGEEVLIQSRDTKSLNRYFPELLKPLMTQLPQRCVLDGEIVVARDGRLDFEALQLRIHPASSRVKLPSQESPASIVFFDLLLRRRSGFAARTVQKKTTGAGVLTFICDSADTSYAGNLRLERRVGLV